MAATDITAILFLLLTAAKGAYQGSLRTLLNPVSLLLSFALSWLWYINVHNFIGACLISIIGPFVISRLLLLAVKRRVNSDLIPVIPPLSRLGGLTIGLAWGGGLAALTVALMSVFPFERFELENLGKDVHRSRTLAIIRPVLMSKGILPANPTPGPCLNDICKMDDTDNAAISSENEMQALLRDPHIQKLLNDPDAMDAIRSQNMQKIMANPVISEMKDDPAFVIKAMRLYPKIQQRINAHEPKAD